MLVMFIGPHSTIVAIQTCTAMPWHTLRRVILAPSTERATVALRRVQRVVSDALLKEKVELMSEVLEELPCPTIDHVIDGGLYTVLFLLVVAMFMQLRMTDRSK
jgi:hypothetical protein